MGIIGLPVHGDLRPGYGDRNLRIVLRENVRNHAGKAGEAQEEGRKAVFHHFLRLQFFREAGKALAEAVPAETLLLEADRPDTVRPDGRV